MIYIYTIVLLLIEIQMCDSSQEINSPKNESSVISSPLMLMESNF